MQSAFKFILKVFTGVEVSALSTLVLPHLLWRPCLSGSLIVHRGIVILEHFWAHYSEGLNKNTQQLCAFNLSVTSPWGRVIYGCDRVSRRVAGH